MSRGCRQSPASSLLPPNLCFGSTASTSGILPASPSSCCCSRRTVSGFRRGSGAAASGWRRCWCFSPLWCCRRRSAPTSRCSFSALTRRLLLARAFWLGDPLAIPLHQMQSGSLLIFAFFMISDPRTTPDRGWAAFCSRCRSRCSPIISRSSCKCGRRFTWR